MGLLLWTLMCLPSSLIRIRVAHFRTLCGRVIRIPVWGIIYLCIVEPFSDWELHVFYKYFLNYLTSWTLVRRLLEVTTYSWWHTCGIYIYGIYTTVWYMRPDWFQWSHIHDESNVYGRLVWKQSGKLKESISH
jgi:uncharacterized protein YhhL (DUF1145 family)